MLKKSRQDELLKLIRKYLRHQATIQEQQFLEKYYEYFDKEKGITGQLTEQEIKKLGDELLAGIHSRTGGTSGRIIPLYKRTWFRAAASVLVLCVIGAAIYFGIQRKESQNVAVLPATGKVKDLLPGTETATLMLADGSVVNLDTVANGLLAQQSNANIVKLANGQLAYTVNGKAQEIQYNTVSTPRGGQYSLVLPDGTVAWLNAASTIRFPVAFTGNERKVEVTGEVYFEVAKNKKLPFRVTKGDFTVEALGTSFNVKAYYDEVLIKTTLIEGAVKVLKGNNMTVLAPEQQASVSSDGRIEVTDAVNVDEVIAWKNGWFEFNSTSLDEIMRQISRWYNVDVVFEGKTTEETFTGIVSRKSNVSQVLRVMEQAGVKFRVEENKITVLQ